MTQSVDKLLRKANLLEEQGEIALAKKQIRKILKVYPRNNKALAKLSALETLNPSESHESKSPSVAQLSTIDGLLKKGDFQEAITPLKELHKQFPNNPHLLNAMGVAHSHLQHLDEAVTFFKQSLIAKPEFAEAHLNLGNAYQKLGKRELAIESYRKAFAINPALTESYRALTRLKDFREYDEDIKAMEQAYANPELDEDHKMQLAYALGKAFEDLQQYERAFEYIDTANSINRSTYTYSVETDINATNKLQKSFSAKYFRNLESPGYVDDTPIFIVGMPRSGTTLVEQILSSHEDVYGAGEIVHLRAAIELLKIPRRNEGMAQDWFKLYRQAGHKYIDSIRKIDKDARFITNKMPMNFTNIGMIKLMLPEAKIIHCCRDPYDTCLSIFKNKFSPGTHKYAYDLKELGLFYNAYRDLMAHWHRVLPGFIYDIHYENLVADQEGQSRSLLDYCVLDWDDACLEFHKSDRAVLTASAGQVRKPIYKDSIKLWKCYEKQLAPLIEILDDWQPSDPATNN